MRTHKAQAATRHVRTKSYESWWIVDIAVRQFIRAGIEMARVLRGMRWLSQRWMATGGYMIRIDHELERIVDRYVESYPDQAENA
jgi:hypothetical protein